MSDLQTIKRLIPLLTAAEREEVRRALAAFNVLQNTGSETNSSSYESLYLQCICDVMRSRGLGEIAMSVLMKHSISDFRAKAVMVTSYLRHSKLTRAEQQTVVTFGVGMLYDNLVLMGVPISPRTIMNHFDRLPAMINKAFPGYAKGGLLSKFVRSKVVHNVREKSSTHAA